MTLDLLIESGWKSGLIATACLAGVSFMRRRPASERVALLRVGVVLIIALPLLATLTPALRIETADFLQPPALSSSAPRSDRSAGLAGAALDPSADSRMNTTVRPFVDETIASIDIAFTVIAVWVLGVAILAVRLVAGITLLSWWTRRSAPLTEPQWTLALGEASQGRPRPLLRVSSRITSPLSWGHAPGVILMDRDSSTQTNMADAVLAHEMAHIRRLDWPFLIASRFMVAMFWFNPMAWLLQRELSRQSEEAADAWAAARVGQIRYATALVALAARDRPYAALAMAGAPGEIGRRVVAILNPSRASGKPWRAAIIIMGCVTMAIPLAAVAVGSSATNVTQAPTEPTQIARAAPDFHSGADARPRHIPAAPRSPDAPEKARESRLTGIGPISAAARSHAPSHDLSALYRSDSQSAAPQQVKPEHRQMVSPQARRVIQNPLQRRMMADGLRQGALQIETQIEIMRRVAFADRDPDRSERILADTDEMLAEAKALRQEADEIDFDG